MNRPALKADLAAQVFTLLPAADKAQVLQLDRWAVERALQCHPFIRAKVLQCLLLCLAAGVVVRITSSLRSFAEQLALFMSGRDKNGKLVEPKKWLSDARPGYSWHNYGLAIDFCILLPDGSNVSWDKNADFDKDKKADWLEVVAIFKAAGFEWGGDWPKGKNDPPHLQYRPNGQSVAQWLAAHNAKQVDRFGYVLPGKVAA